ncbi:hypothetical protein DFJ73DRAFT_965214 [Zopfochytrium polystomum]|nr:hypothetical protein DFJ73DRAFT_965214 [Zopfochytrium polystomum]
MQAVARSRTLDSNSGNDATDGKFNSTISKDHDNAASNPSLRPRPHRRRQWGPAGGVNFRWFLQHYPTLGVVLSLVISLPLAWYKYALARKNEHDIAVEAFASAAQTVVLTLQKSFEFASIAPLLLADFSITAPGPLSSRQFQQFTDATGYFSSIASGFSVGLYQHATSETVGYWRRYMFENHGGNFGDKNGTVSVINNSRADFFFVHHILGEEQQSNKGNLGYIPTSDTQQRGPLLERLRKTGRADMSGRVTLVGSATPTGVIMAAPIFREGAVGTGVGGGGGGGRFTNQWTPDMDAVATTRADVAAMMAASLGSLELNELLHVFVFDAGADPKSCWHIWVVAVDGYEAAAQTSFPLRLLVIALIEPAFTLLFHVSIFAVHRFTSWASSHHHHYPR